MSSVLSAGHCLTASRHAGSAGENGVNWGELRLEMGHARYTARNRHGCVSQRQLCRVKLLAGPHRSLYAPSHVKEKQLCFSSLPHRSRDRLLRSFKRRNKQLGWPVNLQIPKLHAIVTIVQQGTQVLTLQE